MYSRSHILSLKNKFTEIDRTDEQFIKFLMYYQTYNPRKQPPTQSALKSGSSSLRQSGANAKPVVNIKRTLNKISKANYEVLITQLAEEIKTPAYNELEIIDALVN